VAALLLIGLVVSLVLDVLVDDTMSPRR